MTELQEPPTLSVPVPEPVPPSPFERVSAPLRRALERRGFTALTPVQVAALDATDGSRDLRISSQTGSGKTVALGLAMGPGLIETAGQTGPGPRALIVVPTRELAAQVQKELGWLYADVAGVRTDVVTGGTNVEQERRRLRRGPHVLVGTPGRLVDHLRTGALDASGIRELVLDEADQMLDMGFQEDLETIIGAIPAEGRRTHMVSATFPPGVRALTDRYQSAPLHIEGTQLGTAHEDIVHIAHVVQRRDRYGALVNLLLLAGEQRTLVFVATRADAAKLAEKLAEDGFSALPLSGDFAQAQRTRTLQAFRNGAVAVLVATDVAARGLDVPDVTTVIHGDLPMDGEVYTHRSGRTGRAGKKGSSILLATTNGERRAHRLLAQARVKAEWQPVPDAGTVNRSLNKRARRRVRRAIEDMGAGAPESELEFARNLLEEHAPEQVIARLVGLLRTERTRAPFDIEQVAPRTAQRGPRERRADRNDPGPGSYVLFRIQWGGRKGANPRRVLASVCRRGGVSGAVVGSIQIDAMWSTFEIAAHAADAFEHRARRPDKRDPRQVIERL